jgi:hypothetical protein
MEPRQVGQFSEPPREKKKQIPLPLKRDQNDGVKTKVRNPGFGEPGLQGRGLKLLPEEFKNDIANQRRDYSNNKIGERENIFEGEGQALSGAVRARKFPHEEIGIKKKDDETEFDQRSPERRQFSRGIGV